jgi:hypothetical protein
VAHVGEGMTTEEANIPDSELGHESLKVQLRLLAADEDELEPFEVAQLCAARSPNPDPGSAPCCRRDEVEAPGHAQPRASDSAVPV